MFDTETFLTTLRHELAACADPAHSKGQRSFFKEPINPLGVRSRELNAIVSRHWPALKRLEPAQLLGLCDVLWQSDTFEDPVLASKWCARALPRLGPRAFTVIEGWLHARVENWAHCDALCASCLGQLLVRHPDLVAQTLPWLTSSIRWVRRGAAVSCVPAARQGLLLPHVLRVVEALLEDQDDMVRKGYGWLLREASKAHAEEVFTFVLARRGRMPRVALRCAIELLPVPWRAQAMERPET